MALTGRLDVDFVHEPFTAADGTRLVLEAPEADELPQKGFDPGESGFSPPADDPTAVTIVVAPDSDRLELLDPSRRGMVATSPTCGCSPRRWESARPTTFPRRVRGSSTAAISRTSPATCSAA